MGLTGWLYNALLGRWVKHKHCRFDPAHGTGPCYCAQRRTLVRGQSSTTRDPNPKEPTHA